MDTTNWFDKNTSLIASIFAILQWVLFITTLLLQNKFSWVSFPQAVGWSLLWLYLYYKKRSTREKKSDDIFNKFNSTL